jgi:hypothetical protein
MSDEEIRELVRRVEAGSEEALASLEDAYMTLSHAPLCPYRVGGECLCLRGEVAALLDENGVGI